MKPIHYLAVATAAFTIHAGSVASGQIVVGPGPENVLEHNLTVRLTLTGEGEIVTRDTRDGYIASRANMTERISNRVLLGLFVEDGLIDDIRGWSLLAASADGFPLGFFLKKKGEFPVNVTGYFEFDYDDEDAVISFQERERERDNLRAYRIDYSALTLGYVDFVFNGIVISMDGKVLVDSSYEELVDTDTHEYLVQENQLKSFSLENGTGPFFDDSEFGQNLGVVEGSYNAGKGKPSDLGVFPRMAN